MIREFTAFLTAFRAGKELSNAAVWKNRANAASAIVAFLGAAITIAGGFGYGITLEPEQIQQIAGGVVALVSAVGIVLNTVTSKRVGLPTKLDPADQDRGDAAPQPAVGSD
jgi:drug/metabolite transporter (DMT)-like permease